MWKVEIEDAAKDEIRALNDDLKAYLIFVIELIESEGPQDLPPQLVRHIEGKLWELRLKARSGIARALYFTVDPKRVIIVSAFTKKTQKLPTRELEKAKSRMSMKQISGTEHKKGNRK
jgi:phage-related protein